MNDPDEAIQEDEPMEVQRLENHDETINPNDFINLDQPNTSTNNTPTTAEPNSTKKKRKILDEQNDEQEENDRPTKRRKSSFPDWKQLLDDKNVAKAKQDAIEPLLTQISSKVSKEIVSKHIEDETSNECIVVKLGQNMTRNFKSIIKAVRCADEIYHPKGLYKYTKTCDTADCVQLSHWNVGLMHENAVQRNQKKKPRTKAYKEVTEEETAILVQYIMSGIDEHIHDEVRERATEVATQLMVEFTLGATQIIEKLSCNECNHVEGFVPIIIKQDKIIRNLIWFLKHPTKRNTLNLEKIIQSCATNTDKKICMSLSHYTFFDEGRIYIDPAPVTPSNPYPSELRTPNLTNTVSVDVGIDDNENYSENPEDSNEHVVTDDAVNGSSMLNEADYEDDSDVEEDSDDQIQKEIEQECEMIAEIDENEVVNIDLV